MRKFQIQVIVHGDTVIHTVWNPDRRRLRTLHRTLDRLVARCRDDGLVTWNVFHLDTFMMLNRERFYVHHGGRRVGRSLRSPARARGGASTAPL